MANSDKNEHLSIFLQSFQIHAYFLDQIIMDIQTYDCSCIGSFLVALFSKMDLSGYG